MVELQFAAYSDVTGTPHVVVDGSAQAGTVLTLSHWPRSGTPPDLLADLSAESAFLYLDTPEHHVPPDVEAVTNNHFDQDGLMGLYALADPDGARARHDRVVDVASAGDFATYRERDAARVAMAIAAWADEERSPAADAIAGRGYGERTAVLYEELLGRLPALLDDPERARPLWEDEDAHLDESERLLASERVTISESPGVDLAVVTVPDDVAESAATRFSWSVAQPLHPMAINNATDRFRILTMQGRRYELEFRYETWVQFVSRPAPARRDLTPLAENLSADEPGDARWVFDGVADVTPRLRLIGAPESAIAPEEFRARVEAFLASAPPAWDPFGHP